MFKKIVSNLPFCPTLVEQLGFYMGKLKTEENIRRLGLLFIILTIAVQSLSVLQAPESANASNSNDMITGGIISKNVSELLKIYDNNTQNFKDIVSYVGITRANLASVKFGSLKLDNKLVWGATPYFSYNDGEREHKIYSSDGSLIRTIYSRPTVSGSNSNVAGWVGRASFGAFSILKSSGNLVTDTIPPKPANICQYNSNILAIDGDCLPCKLNDSLWENDRSCVLYISFSQTAVGASSATQPGAMVRAGDKVDYILTAENSSTATISGIKIEDNIADILEYANLVETGSGIYNSATKTISWPEIEIGAKSKQTRTFTIQLLDPIPATATGTSSVTSYDCVIANTFGNSININVKCPTSKQIEQLISNLPLVGTKANAICSIICLAVASYFYARSRQQNKEMRLIKKDISTGAL